MRCMIPASSSWQRPFVIVFLHSSLFSFHPGKRWGRSRPGRVQAVWLREATANSGIAQRESREACPRPDCSEAGCLAQCANLHLGISAFTFWLTFLSRYFRKGSGSSHLAPASPPAETIFKGANGCTGCWPPVSLPGPGLPLAVFPSSSQGLPPGHSSWIQLHFWPGHASSEGKWLSCPAWRFLSRILWVAVPLSPVTCYLYILVSVCPLENQRLPQ